MGRISKVFLSAIGASVLGLAVGGCAADAPRDAGGTIVSMSPGTALKAEDTDLNIAVWIDPRLVRDAERKLRDNSGINETVNLVQTNGQGRGVVHSERLPGGIFSDNTKSDLADRTKFDAFVRASLAKLGNVDHATPEAISHTGSTTTVGYKTIATVGGSTSCFVARAGYRLGKGTAFDNDRKNLDTVLSVIYCDPARKFAELDTLVSRVAVKEPADVQAIRARYGGAPPAR
jgi:hypothetical protein